MARDMGTRMSYSEEVGRARYELYRGANRRLKQAIENGFWIEAVALCESILSDRIEARLSHLGGHEEEARKHKTLGALVRQIKSSDPKNGYEYLHSIYQEVGEWNTARNSAIHRAVKISEGEEFRSWNERYNELEETATNGVDLVRRLSGDLRKIKAAYLRKANMSF